MIYVFRATLYGGIGAVVDGDGAQIVFTAIALLIGIGYGALAHVRAQRRGRGAAAATVAL